MIAQQETAVRGARADVIAQAAQNRDAVVEYLTSVGGATVPDLAAHFGKRENILRGYLVELYYQGKVKRSEAPSGTPGRPVIFWQAGCDDEAPEPGVHGARWTRATQTGKARRDALVAALFGPARQLAGCGG